MTTEPKLSAEESIAWFIAGEVGGEGAEPTEAMHGQAKELIGWLKLDGVEVWRPGGRTSPTREQVRMVVHAALLHPEPGASIVDSAADAVLSHCNGSYVPTRAQIEDVLVGSVAAGYEGQAADKVIALLSGQSPTGTVSDD